MNSIFPSSVFLSLLIVCNFSFSSSYTNTNDNFQLKCRDEAENCENFVKENRCSLRLGDLNSFQCRKSCGLCNGEFYELPVNRFALTRTEVMKTIQTRGAGELEPLPPPTSSGAGSGGGTGDSTIGTNGIPTSSCKDMDPVLCKGLLGGSGGPTGNPNPSVPVSGTDTGANPQGQGACCIGKAFYNATCAKTCHFCTETSLPLNPTPWAAGNGVQRLPSSVVTQQDPCNPTGGSPPSVGVGNI